MTSPAAQEVLDFWFGELTGGFSSDAVRVSWFTVDRERDAEIERRFGALLEQAAAGSLGHWRETPADTLALILICDQFSRQIHRGSARAFATDALALDCARGLVANGADLDLPFDHRVFVYMPFEHAEARVDQHASVGLFSALRDATPAGQRHLTGTFLQHAHQHRDIVLRFGRFPHRNAALGRTSSAAESAFLRDAGNFGQSRPDGDG